MSLIGREDSQVFGADSLEERRWIGKPWRRLELMTNRTFWRGEEVDGSRSRDMSVHIGLRRLGIGLTLAVTKAPCLDYDDDSL